MRLGIMQPYFLPYLGYFDLIRNTDRWIVFDTPQYIRHGWVNRNRILHPRSGWQYMIVPLRRHSHQAPIQDIEIDRGLPWQQRIVGQLSHYRRRAPHYRFTVEFLREALDFSGASLACLNVHLLGRVCELLGIPFQGELLSDMSLALGAIEQPGDWALRIATAVGASEYINPPGGAALFDAAAFAAAGVTLTIRQPPGFEYPCPGYTFCENLSIVDLLMWNSVAEISTFLSQHALPDSLSGDH